MSPDPSGPRQSSWKDSARVNVSITSGIGPRQTPVRCGASSHEVTASAASDAKARA
jgi:hypothetical protein